MITNIVLFLVLTQLSTIDGRVRDGRNHAAIAFARIELWSAQRLTDVQYSDDDGRFHFDDVESGAYTISVAQTGYQTAITELDRPRGPGRISIELTPVI